MIRTEKEVDAVLSIMKIDMMKSISAHEDFYIMVEVKDEINGSFLSTEVDSGNKLCGYVSKSFRTYSFKTIINHALTHINQLKSVENV